MLQLVQHTPNLALREAMVTGLEIDGDPNGGGESWDPSQGPAARITGVRTYFGSVYGAKAVILTAGTFLGGRIWVGHQSMAAGRAGEQAAEGLTKALQQLGFHTDRLKTGTPARVDRRSIALDQLEEQPSDAADRFFSFDPAAWASGEQMSCHITRTTAATHKLIKDNLHLTAIYGGVIDSKGPRYCPSIEDKIAASRTRTAIRSSWSRKAIHRDLCAGLLHRPANRFSCNCCTASAGERRDAAAGLLG